MAESLLTGQTPAITDAADPPTKYDLGYLFSPAADGTIDRLGYYAAATTPAQDEVVSLYTDAGVLLARVTFAVADIAEGGWNWSADLRDAGAVPVGPVAVTGAVTYVVSQRTADRYVATTGFFTGGYDNGANLSAPVQAGRLNEDTSGGANTPAFPLIATHSCFFADVEFTAAGAPVTVASAGAQLAGAQLAGAGGKRSTGAAAGVAGLLLAGAGRKIVQSAGVLLAGGAGASAAGQPPTGTMTGRARSAAHITTAAGTAAHISTAARRAARMTGR